MTLTDIAGHSRLWAAGASTPCPEVVPTPSGYKPPLLPVIPPEQTIFPNPPGRDTEYTIGGLPYSWSNNVWHFPQWRLAGGHGLVDACMGGVGNNVFIYPKGDGFATLYALCLNGGTGAFFRPQILQRDGDVVTVLADYGYLPANIPVQIELTKELFGTCEHVISVLLGLDSTAVMAWDGWLWESTERTGEDEPGIALLRGHGSLASSL